MSEVNFKFNNGDLLRDSVTGYEGVVMVRAEYSTGCHHYGLQPRNPKDNVLGVWEWIDQSRLSLVERSVVSFNLPKDGTTSGAFPSGPS